ncbi:Proto-oncogene FRAT1 [Heterocephalus glaber]|uniref:Proto-oncogene FRAT1 n=1 Tax=Heterocephalus glaber TaxID=10181 RepID=G5C0A7_HETGA|nr:Proto-oncogene FRAT1 [Heterocephalus glaber]
MPCRREEEEEAGEEAEGEEEEGSFLLLEQSVTLGGSGEVDRLPEPRAGDDDPHRLLQQLVLSGNLIKEAVRRLHARRLQLQAKLPQGPLLGPLSAPVHEPPSPRSPRAACSDPGPSGRRAQLRTGDSVLVPGS